MSRLSRARLWIFERTGILLDNHPSVVRCVVAPHFLQLAMYTSTYIAELPE
ncbi:MAG: hypothetical protein ACR2JC_05595 [Chloroflexota bacterium]